MIRILCVTLLLLTAVCAQSQENSNTGKITGRVVDSVFNKPVEYATITLYKGPGKKIVTGTITQSDGRFTLTGLDTGIYRITIESIGYVARTFNNVLLTKNNPVVNLTETGLSPVQHELQNVTVNSSVGLIENKIDKLVFNAEKDLTSQAGVATDILKKVPQVSVDIDGNVELAGSTSIRFLINGKPSAAFGSNIADVLQSIPASQIKSIEVITNPGARYDAQGLGGIINIILKQTKVKGINGNLSMTTGTRNENGSFNFNARKGELGFNAFVSGNVRLKAKTPSSSGRLSHDTAALKDIQLLQNGNYQFKRHGVQSGVGFDWTYNKKNNFSGSIAYSNFGNQGNGVTSQSQVIKDQNNGTVLSSIASTNHSLNQSSFHNTDVNLNYKRAFEKEDQELEIGFDMSRDKGNGKAANYQLLLPQDSLFYGIDNNNPAKENETELQIDYTQPLKEDVIFSAGGKINYYEIITNSLVLSYEPASKKYEPDSSLTNNLDYKQHVYALYSEISFPVAHWFDARIGARYERTQINSYYSNAQHQAPSYGYNTWVPSIYFSRELGDKQMLKLSYSKRIERPDYEDLNPAVNTTDPNNISAGNPNLRPETGHRIELSYNRNFAKAGSFIITAFYRINNDDIQPFITFYPSLKVGDSTYTNVSVTMRQNIGKEINRGASVFLDLHPGTKFIIRSNLFFFHRHTVNVLDPGFNTNSFNYRFNVNTSYQFSKTMLGEFFGNFNSPRHEAQGKYPSFTSYSIALRKQFWNKKGSLAISANNFLSKYVNQRSHLFGSNFTVDGLRQVPFRSVSINFTWKFGKLEFKKDDKQDNNLQPPSDN